jgi:tRNA pseudouridine38-40 synthase
VFCAGRTDAGVHARGQVVHTDLPRSAFDRRTLYGLLAQLNHQTDPQVLCRIAAWAPPFFDARFSALSRHYVYRICDDALLVDPLTQRWVTYHPRRLSASAMAQAAQHLVGKHDFAAFCRRKARATTIREVLYLDVSRDAAQRVEIRIGADAFCHSMVRSLVGGLVAVGEGRRSPKWLAEVLESRSRDSAAGVMAAHGLVLERVDYPPAELMEQRNRKSRQLRTM